MLNKIIPNIIRGIYFNISTMYTENTENTHFCLKLKLRYTFEHDQYIQLDNDEDVETL